MHGLSINGFVIVETMGSGRFGNLYLARHPVTGKEAIIRLVSEGENGTTMQVFLDEAASLLPGSHQIQRAPMSDGREVLVAVPSAPTAANHAAPTEKLQQQPGTGWSQHPNTDRLGRLSNPQQPRSVVQVAILLVGVACLGAGGAAFWLSLRAPAAAPSQPAPVVVVAPQPPVPAPAKVETPAVAVAPTEVVVPRPAEPKPPAAAPRTPDCTPDADWHRDMELTLRELGTLSARDEALSRKYDQVEPALGRLIIDARNQAECAKAEKQMNALKRLIVPNP